MTLIVCLAALAVLITLAYRGFSVILIAPLAAMAAVLLTEPSAVAPAYSGLFMEKLASFVKLYLPLFLLGALFGKLVEISGMARSIAGGLTRLLGPRNAILAVVLAGMVLTYGGVSVFVVVFAVYPFASELFRQADIPKRLIPATLAFGAFTITMDALPGTPQIQNIIPTAFFGTTAYAAPVLGLVASAVTFLACLAYLEWRRARALAAGEGYGEDHRNEPDADEDAAAPMAIGLALIPLLVVGLGNRILLTLITDGFGHQAVALLDPAALKPNPIVVEVKANAALWAVEAALALGIVTALLLGGKALWRKLAPATNGAVGGALLAGLNTASEYGFGAVIAALPGFRQIAGALSTIHDPLLNVAVTTNVLCAMTGSASGGLSLTLGAFSHRVIQPATANRVPLEVVHRVAALASGGMDTLPHNGAIVTLLAVTGLTHRQAYKDIFAITLIKTAAGFVAVAMFHLTGLS
jgi:H+/gluconate symporter-like permease